MELTLAVFDPETSLSWPVRISGRTGSPGALVGEILSERLGRNASWYIGDLPLDGTSLGTAPLVDGAVVRARPVTEDVEHTARLSIACTEGFGAGFRARIGRGVHAVGRDDVDIRLENPHLPPCAGYLSVSGESVTLRPVGRLSGIRLLPGHRLGLHGSSLVIEDAQGHPTHAASRSPIPAHEVRLLAPSQGWAVMLATSLTPIAFGAVAAWLWGMWFMLLFGAMSALVSGAHWLTRGGGAARNRRRLHDARVRELNVLAQAIPPVGLRLADAVARIEGTLPARSNGMTDTASSPLSGDELWIRWGRGTRHLHISPNSPQTGPQVKDMPLVTSLSLPHVLVMSDGVRTDGLPALIGHALAEHLVLEWVGCAGDCRICTEFLRRWGRLCVPASGRGSARTSPVLQMTCVRRGVRTAEEGPRPAVWKVYVGADRDPVPVCPGWRGMVIVPTQRGLRLVPHGNAGGRCPGLANGSAVECLAPDVPDSRILERLAQGHRSNGSVGGDTGCLMSSREDLAVETAPERWNRTRYDRALLADLGRAPVSGAPVVVDLNDVGPHCVVAGATGSGKSEFLRSLVLGMALRYPPERLGFVLIDFKGGASFGPLCRLRHVHATLTDLDETAVLRDLAFLRAELRRREALFATVGARNWVEYLEHCATKPGRDEVLPEIAVVVDEFRVLVDSFPRAMDRLLHIATTGRSLGFHLIMSTQRPQGAISPDIRANVSVNVCFRVASDADSISVIGTPQAASLSSEGPGAGLVKVDGVVLGFRAWFVDRLPALPPGAPHIVEGHLTFPSGDPVVGGSPPESSIGDDVARFGDLIAPGRVALRFAVPPRSTQVDCSQPLLPPPTGADPGRHPSGLFLGLGEAPARAWQGPLFWRARDHGVLEVVGTVPQQRAFVARLVLSASHASSVVYVLAADKATRLACVSARHAGSDLRGIAGLDDPLFILEVLRRLVPVISGGSRPGALVIVQGVDRLLEAFLSRGHDLSVEILNLLTAGDAPCNVVLLGAKRVPPELRPYCSSHVFAHRAETNEYRAAHPRESLEILAELSIVDGRVCENRAPVGLNTPPESLLTHLAAAVSRIIAQDDADRTAAHRRRSRLTPPEDTCQLPRFRRVDSDLSWAPFDDAGRDRAQPSRSLHDRPVDPTATSESPRGTEILLGVSSPLGEECRTRVHQGEGTALVYSTSGGEQRMIDALEAFNPHLQFRVFVPPENHRHAKPTGPDAKTISRADACVAVVRNVPAWTVAPRHIIADIIASHDACIMTFPMDSSATVASPWTETIRSAHSAIFVGPLSHGCASFRSEPVPPHRLALDQTEGLLVERGSWTRFRIPAVRRGGPAPRHSYRSASLGEVVGPQQMILDRRAEQENPHERAVGHRKQSQEEAPRGDHLQRDHDQEDLREQNQGPRPQTSLRDTPRSSEEPQAIPDVEKRHDHDGPERHRVVLEEDLDRLHQAGNNQPQPLDRDESRQDDNGQGRASRSR
jgi:hypothetical protein